MTTMTFRVLKRSSLNNMPRKQDNSTNKYVEFWSKDDDFGLRLSANCLNQMIKYCAKSYPRETGGILIGSYNKSRDCAIVGSITGPPKDSKQGRVWFKRGIHGLQKRLEKHWKNNKFYLGEWHFHPDGEPFPSETDKNQLKKIAESGNSCYEPILIIIGGHPQNVPKLKVFVFPRNSVWQELFSCQT